MSAHALWWFPDSEHGTPLIARATNLGYPLVGRRVRPASDRWRLATRLWWTGQLTAVERARQTPCRCGSGLDSIDCAVAGDCWRNDDDIAHGEGSLEADRD